MALSWAVATSTGGAGAVAGVGLGAGAAWGSVATRVRGRGAAAGTGESVGAGVGGTHRVCIGATRIGSAVCSRHSNVPLRPKTKAMCTASTAATSQSGARRDGGAEPVELALALECAGTRALLFSGCASPDRPTVAARIGASFAQSAHPMRCRVWRTNPAPPRPQPSAHRRQRQVHKTQKCQAAAR
jgi:hypothetical protein